MAPPAAARLRRRGFTTVGQASAVHAAETRSHAGAIGIVLAGGGSTRLGPVAPVGGKAALELAGRPLLGTVAATVAAEVDELYVVAAPGQPLPPLPAAAVIVRDRTPGAGPLAGIRDGLEAAVGRSSPPGVAFICSCDVPLLRRELVRLLVDRGQAGRADWVVPVVHGHLQVLLSVVAVRLLPRIDAYLATGRRDPRGLLAALAGSAAGGVDEVSAAECAAVDPDLASFIDIDTPEDLAGLARRKYPPSAG